MMPGTEVGCSGATVENGTDEDDLDSAEEGTTTTGEDAAGEELAGGVTAICAYMSTNCPHTASWHVIKSLSIVCCSRIGNTQVDCTQTLIYHCSKKRGTYRAQWSRHGDGLGDGRRLSLAERSGGRAVCKRTVSR